MKKKFYGETLRITQTLNIFQICKNKNGCWRMNNLKIIDFNMNFAKKTTELRLEDRTKLWRGLFFVKAKYILTAYYPGLLNYK